MGSLKLVDAGVFFYKKRKMIILVAVAVMLITVLITCLPGNPYSAQQTIKFANNSYLVGMVQKSNIENVTYYAGEVPYPQDQWAVEYAESIKVGKSSTGRTNPFRSADLFPESKLASYFGTEDFKQYLTENGVDRTKISILVTSDTISVTSLEQNNDLCKENMAQVTKLCASYIDKTYKETITQLRATYEAMLTADTEKMQTVLASYEAAKAESSDLQNDEECRRLLNEYAQLAYDYDVSVAVISICDDLTASSLEPATVVQSVNYVNARSATKLLCYAVLGFVVGLIIGGFASFIVEYLKAVKQKALQEKVSQENA